MNPSPYGVRWQSASDDTALGWHEPIGTFKTAATPFAIGQTAPDSSLARPTPYTHLLDES